MNTIYCFWTGRNAMSGNRDKCHLSLHFNSSADVKLITPENLSEFVVKSRPLHPAYEYLSNVHKSDYLRAYFMHHYGGGYSDVKWCARSWDSAFDRFRSSGKQIMGYREPSPDGVAPVGGTTEAKLRAGYRDVIGCCAFICKPNSLFTAKWLGRVESILDSKHGDLRNNKGNIMGDNEGYPLAWTEIMGNVFHPLCLELSGVIAYDNTIMPVFNKKYR